MRGTEKVRNASVSGIGEIKSLTGLRGVAAFFVMLYHFTVMSLGSDPASVFVRKCYIWVDLFFMLSGFIMALTFADQFLNGQGGLRVAYWLFLIRRLARVYPLYFLVTVESAIAAVRPMEQVPGLDSFQLAVAANIAMIQSWGIAPSFEGAAWSISTEWAAYLLFPGLLAITVAPRRHVAIGFGLVSLMAIAFLSAMPAPGFPGQPRMGPLDIYSSASLAPLLRCLAEFSLGLFAYRWFRSIVAKPGQGGQLVRWSVPLFLSIVVAMAIPNADVLVVALFPLLIVSLALQAGPLSRVFGSRIPVWLGQISYSLYLLHGKFVRMIDWDAIALRSLGRGAHPVSVALTILLACACATVVYHAVERPTRALVREAFERNLQLRRRRNVQY
jgi:peptidoglycan/LPS O-acetylase OafA/YrhL